MAAPAEGAAKRRRERRLREWLHERMTVAMALAESNNHAA